VSSAKIVVFDKGIYAWQKVIYVYYAKCESSRTDGWGIAHFT